MARAVLASLCLLLLAGAARPQEPSAKDLRTLLHADVKQYANDGHLVASWALRKPEDLNGFKRSDELRARVVEDQGLEFSPTPTSQAVVLFRELEFQQPCTISFELKLDDPASSFALTFVDPGHPEGRVEVGLNMPIFRDASARYEIIGLRKNGAQDGMPTTSPSVIPRGAWTPVTIELKKDRLALAVAKTERCACTGIAYKRFSTALVGPRGKAIVRSLSVDSQVDRDSIRKLFRSVTANATSRPKTNGSLVVTAQAWRKVEEESAIIEMSATSTAEVQTLPSEARAAVDAGLESMETEHSPKALDCFEKALGLAPKSAVVLWLAGVAAGDGNQPEKATQYLEKSVSTDAKLAPAWLALGRMRARRDEETKALEAFGKAEALDPADAWVNVARAYLHTLHARLADARRDVERALAKRPESEGIKLLSKSLEKLSARPDWKESFKKENEWYLVETSISSKAAADLAQRLVVYRRYLEKAFPLPIKKSTPPSRVWIFDSEEEYHVFAGSLSGGHEQTDGIYYPLIKTLLLISSVSAPATQHVLFHESFHQYLDLVASRPPIWMNEGLAEYFGSTTFDVSGRPTEGGILAMRLPTLRAPLVPIKTLMLLPQPLFMNPRGVGIHYAESWALVHFFKQGGNVVYSKLFDDYCAAVIAGKSQVEAFDTTFGSSAAPPIDTIEREFRTYVTTRLLKP